jgi:phosphoglycolate phosphatase
VLIYIYIQKDYDNMTSALGDGVIFDLDGTLLDTLHDIAGAFNAVLQRHGLPLHAPDAYRRFVGDGAEELARRALPAEWRSAERIALCSREYVSAYGALSPVAALPYPGIPPLLDALTARHLPMAVLSNKSHDNTLASVAALLGAWAFAPVLGLRHGVARKPDPAGAIEIARCLSLPPGRIVFVGDTAIDMQTAAAAGMIPVGACWGFRGETELRAAGARFLLHHPMELIGVLDGGRSV